MSEYSTIEKNTNSLTDPLKWSP